MLEVEPLEREQVLAGVVGEAADPEGMDLLPMVLLGSAPKKAGRPRVIAPVGERVSILVDLSMEDREQFKRYCEMRGLKMATVLREYVREVNRTHTNTPKELRQERFNAWVERNKNMAGFSLEKALATFREIEKLETAREKTTEGEEIEWEDQGKAR